MANEPSAKRRDDLIWVEAVVIGCVSFLVLRFAVEPTFPANEIPLAILFVALLTVFSTMRIDVDIGTRQFEQELAMVPATVALFLVTPGWYVVVFTTYMAIYLLRVHPKMPIASKAMNLALHLLIATFSAWLYTSLAPSGPTDGWRALLVASSVWFFDTLLVAICWIPYGYFKYGHFRKNQLLELFRRSPVTAAKTAVPLLLMVVWSVSPWFVLPVLLVTGLALYAARVSYLLLAYRDGFDAISDLSAKTAMVNDPRTVIEAVLVSVRRVGGVVTAGVVEVTADGTISWHGDPRDSLRRAFPDVWSVRKMAAIGHGSIRVGALESAAVWPLDEEKVLYLVVAMERPDRDLQEAYSLLEQIAHEGATAVTAARQHAQLAERAEADYHRARCDEITQLPNRFATLEFLNAGLAGSTSASFSLIAASINGLQSVTDVLGESFADQERVRFAERLLALEAAFVGAVDPGMFLVVVECDSSGAVSIASEIANYQSAKSSLRCRDASVGIVAYNPDAELTAESLMKRARWALEHSQHTGEVETFSEASAEEQHRRLAVQMNLPSVISKGGIFAMYQPQIRLADNKLVGVEALARWSDETLGNVSPAEFIPVAEQTDHIEALTRSMIDQSVRALDRWRARGLEIDLSVNISGTSLHHPEFVEYLSDVIGRHDQPTSRVAIEITESSLISGSDSSLDVLHRLHATGAKLSIDDFGVGYSSLGYLDELPVDVIKLDRSLITNLSTSRDQAHIAEGVIKICHKLGHTVVGEGIEDAATMRQLKEMGCDIGQGFYIGRPMSEEQFEAWIANVLPTLEGDEANAAISIRSA